MKQSYTYYNQFQTARVEIVLILCKNFRNDTSKPLVLEGNINIYIQGK